jgi:hypothetical protein
MTLKVKYFGDFLVIFENALGYESGDNAGLIQENISVKNT